MTAKFFLQGKTTIKILVDLSKISTIFWKYFRFIRKFDDFEGNLRGGVYLHRFHQEENLHRLST